MINDEIKEIIIALKESSEGKYINPFELTDDDCKKLLNYITNLQQELEKAKADLYSANQVISDLIDVHEENERLKKQVSKYQDEIFARDNDWYDMQD